MPHICVYHAAAVHNVRVSIPLPLSELVIETQSGTEVFLELTLDFTTFKHRIGLGMSAYPVIQDLNEGPKQFDKMLALVPSFPKKKKKNQELYYIIIISVQWTCARN